MTHMDVFALDGLDLSHCGNRHRSVVLFIETLHEPHCTMLNSSGKTVQIFFLLDIASWIFVMKGSMFEVDGLLPGLGSAMVENPLVAMSRIRCSETNSS